jgi:3-oxoadipate enol-lactonase
MSERDDDFSLSYIDSCDQLTLLLIHGYPLNSAMWEPQVEDLAGSARVIAPDLRGHGRSDITPPPYTIGMMADDCADLLDFLGIERPVVVGGLSMGGYVAFEFYRRYPERVAGLILASTRALPDTPQAQAGRDQAIAKAQAEGVEAVAATLLPKLFAPENYAEDQELVEFVQDIMAETSLEGMIGALHAMRDRADSTPTLAEIEVPTLIIHGAEDQIVPVDEARAMKRAIRSAKLVVIPEAGHMVNLERIDEFNDAVLDFLEEFAEDEDEEDGHYH